MCINDCYQKEAFARDHTIEYKKIPLGPTA